MSTSGMATEKLVNSKLPHSLQGQVFCSLAKIERYLKRHDPQGLQRISEWYQGFNLTREENSAEVAAPNADQDQEDYKRRLRRRRRKLRRRKMKQNFMQLQCYEYNSNCSNNCTGWVRRVEQNEIDEAKLAYLRIPKGTATRGLLVPPPPDWLFDESLPDPLTDAARFNLDSNASNAEESSRRSAEREMTRMGLERWVFLYFLMLRANWESVVVEEKKSAPDVNMYAEEHLHKWTVRLRFKIMRQVAMKVALCGFLSRMGLESNTKIVFCRDGFYGLMDVGNIYGETTKTPYCLISLNSTPRYLGLKNGDCIFVNSCSATQRQMMEQAPTRPDVPRRRQRAHSIAASSIGGAGFEDYASRDYSEDDIEEADLNFGVNFEVADGQDGHEF